MTTTPLEDMTLPAKDMNQDALLSEDIAPRNEIENLILPIPSGLEPTFPGLPLEIRENIYEYWLRNSRVHKKMRRYLTFYGSSSGNLDRIKFNMFFTSKQVYREVQRVFWSRHRFTIASLQLATTKLTPLHEDLRAQMRWLNLGIEPEPEREAEELRSQAVNIRSLVPNLRSVRFRAERDGRRPTSDLMPDAERLATQIEPFRNVQDIVVDCVEFSLRWSTDGLTATLITEPCGAVKIGSGGTSRAWKESSSEDWKAKMGSALEEVFCKDEAEVLNEEERVRVELRI
ncbi:MAG: hypothetical protein M1831_000074 [Alyxoria varia]|nr:MAG: hypothetical protein M1831_000074 [Alyxoria varia]